MQFRKIIHYSIIALLLISISFGFFNLTSEDIPTTAEDFLSLENPEQNNTNLISNDLELVGSWSLGGYIAIGRYHGMGVGMTTEYDTQYLFFIGGDSNGTGALVRRNDRYNVYYYNWETRASLPLAVWFTDAATLGSYIYICGGLTTSAFTSAVNTVQRYNDITNSWTNVTPLPYATAYNQQVGYQDSLIYSIGGFNTGTSVCNANVLLYNRISNTWRTATPLPAARGGGVAVINGDSIWYVCGGTSYNAGLINRVYRGTINQSNRAIITWVTTTNYPGTGWHRLTGDNWQCKGIIVGPSSPSGFGVTNQIFTLSGNTWIAQPNLLIPTCASHAGSVNMGNDIYKYLVVSGYQQTSPYSNPFTQIFTDTLCITPTRFPTICRNGLNKYIFNLITVYDTINISGFANCVVIDVNVKIDTVVHTWDSDMIFKIRRGSTNVTLIDHRGGAGDNFIKCTLNDSAENPISSGSAPFTGVWRSEEPLSIFNGSTPDGQWILSILDDAGGDTGLLKAWCIRIMYAGPCSGIQTIEIPSDYSLKQNYPNPFNPTTKISFALPKAENVKLVVYDILGREVAVLVNEYRNQGIHTIDFDATGISSGVYFYRIEAGNFTATKRMLLVK